jgi:hypothetical protein
LQLDQGDRYGNCEKGHFGQEGAGQESRRQEVGTGEEGRTGQEGRCEEGPRQEGGPGEEGRCQEVDVRQESGPGKEGGSEEVGTGQEGRACEEGGWGEEAGDEEGFSEKGREKGFDPCRTCCSNGFDASENGIEPCCSMAVSYGEQALRHFKDA